MLKAKAGDNLIFGLSARNIELLKQGKPISVDLREMGEEKGTVLIFYGETEDDMARELMNSMTKVHPSRHDA